MSHHSQQKALDRIVTVINKDINYVKAHNGLGTSDVDPSDAPEGTTEGGNTSQSGTGSGSGTNPGTNPPVSEIEG